MESSNVEGGTYYSDSALLVLVEDLVEQRKVLLVSKSLAGAKRLAEIAEEVCVLHPAGTGEITPTEGLSVTALKPGRLPFDDAYFDAVVIPDLFDLGKVEQSLIELRRVLREDGLLVAGVANPDAPESAAAPQMAKNGMRRRDLAEVFKGHFDTVQVVAQLPFFGFSLVDLSEAQALNEVSFDGTLLGDAEQTPSRYIALCSNDQVAIDAVTVVQVPGSALDEWSAASKNAALSEGEENDQVQGEIQRFEEALNERSAELRSMREELERRSVLVRDLIEQMRKRERAVAQYISIGAGSAMPDAQEKEAAKAAVAPSQSPIVDVEKLRGERDAAVARALESEVARMEAQLHIDELSGYLAVSIPPTAPGGKPPEELVKAPSDEVRQLRALVAQLEEAKLSTETRLASVEEQLAAARDRCLTLERQASETDKRLETLGALEQVTDELKSAHRDVDDLRSAESVLRLRLSEAETGLLKEQRKAEELVAKIAERDGQLEQMEANVSERQQAILVLERSVASLTAELERLQQNLEVSKAVEKRGKKAESRAEKLEGALGETLESLSSLADAVNGFAKGTPEAQGTAEVTEVVIEEQPPASES